MVDEILKIVVANIPNMIGLILCIAIQARAIDRAGVEYEALEKKYDALAAKTLEIALTCRDEAAKSKMLEFQRQQTAK